MALVIGNQTNSNLNPGGTTQTLSHNHSGGVDGLLLVTIAMANTVTVTGMTYNGVAMTQIRQDTATGISSRYASYYLLSPSTGANNIVISFSAAQWSPTAIFAVSFSGSSGIGNSGFDNLSATPNSQTLTISANSVIFAMGNSNFSQSFGYVVDGTTLVNVGNGFNINNIVEGAYSSNIATAGSKTVNTVADAGNINNFRIEIQESGGGPVGSSEGSWFLMF